MPVNNKDDSVKSSVKAEDTRRDGNKLYVDRSFFDALLKYNESLCHAVTGSEAVGLAYANRSAVYFEMKLYMKCLANIDLAKANGYPEKNFAILDKRADKCNEQIKAGHEARREENPYGFIKLTHDPNPNLPFVANCLELRTNSKFGRYIVTNQNLKVGDIVAIESPHFRVIKSDSRYEGCMENNRYQRCAYCLSDNLLDLIPCHGCSSSESFD